MKLYRLMTQGLAAGITSIALLACSQGESPQPPPDKVVESSNWITWGGDKGNTRYSPLQQISGENFDELEVIWRWQATDVAGRPNGNWKATPLYIDGVLYIPTGEAQIAAIDPTTGDTLWLFTPEPEHVGTRRATGSSRAVSYWTDGNEKRLIHNTTDGRLLSVDAITGKPDLNFGQDGQIDLNKNLLAPNDNRELIDVGSSNPAIIVGDVVIAQIIANDTPKNKVGTPGYIRGYDVRTGKLLWTFHTIPQPGEFGHETWEDDSWTYTGAAGVWTMMSADPKLGYVYLPVESPTNNFWGGQRKGDGLFGESIVCLDAKTGKRVWHFQVLHHGVWDYDLPAAPILHDINKDGKTIKAVTLLTKQGMDFVFDRVTGEPIWPIEERSVPTEMGVPGEKLSPTQPFPTKPAPYSNLGFHEEDVIDFTPELRAEAMAMLDNYVKGPMYTPPTLVEPGKPNKGTLLYPNFGGGSNWNGGAVDIETNRLFVPTRNTFMTIGLQKANPELTDWDYAPTRGGGLLYLPNGLPLNRPPWSLVTATDMNKGEHIWSRPIGGAPDWIRDHPALKGLNLDFDNMGQISVRPSPLVTKTALFLAESANIGGDPGGKMFRAYDKQTGEVIGEIELPAKTSGAPMTYLHEGRQYIAIALSERSHPAELIVLALPREGEVLGVIKNSIENLGVSGAKEKVSATPEQLIEGRKTYGQICAGCHGADGKGIPQSGAPALTTLVKLSDIKKAIINGSAEMPAMGSMLKPEQIEAVSRFVAIKFSDL